MRPLGINLASRPFRNNTLLWTGHAMLATATVLFTAWNTVTYVETGRLLAEERSTVGSIAGREDAVELRERQVEADLRRFDLKDLGIRTTRANQVIQRRAFSWTRLFNLLEDTQPYEVKLAALRPVFGGTSRSQAAVPVALAADEVVPVTVEGTSKDLRAFLEFERSLIADRHFDRVEPERTTHSPNGEVLFRLSFLYFPVGRDKEAGADLAAAAPDTAAPPPADAEPTAGNAPSPAPAPAPAPAAETAAEAPAAEVPSATTPANVTAPAAPEPLPAEAGAARSRYPRTVKEPPAEIRKRPPGWQPPDPFAKDAKKKPDKGPEPGGPSR